MLFAYRSGKSEPTLKAWRKLEAAERAAGIHQDTSAGDTGIAGNKGQVKYPTAREARKNTHPEKGFSDLYAAPGFSKLEEISAKISAVQEEFQQTVQQATAGFSMEELIFRMQAANAWPPSPEDGKLSPALLMLKYQPPANPNAP